MLWLRAISEFNFNSFERWGFKHINNRAIDETVYLSSTMLPFDLVEIKRRLLVDPPLQFMFKSQLTV